MLRALTTHCQHSRNVWHLAGMLWNWGKSKQWNRTPQAMMFFNSVLFGKATWLQGCWWFCCSTKSSKNNSVNMMNSLRLAFLPSIWKIERNFHWNQTFTSNFLLLSASVSPQLDDLLCQLPNVNSRLKLCIWNFHHLLFKTSMAVSLNKHWTKIYFSQHVFASLLEA